MSVLLFGFLLSMALTLGAVMLASSDDPDGFTGA
jgi:hypothetical protein